MMETNRITSIIIEEAIRIHRDLGPGLLESVYESVLARRLEKRGLLVRRQVDVTVDYDGERHDVGFRMDMLVEERVVVELKSVEILPLVAYKVVTTYLRFADKEVALLINFGEETLKDGLHRIVNKYRGPKPGDEILPGYE
ncbi:MAG TPA: GxxExxY protein [Flavobacteriales bacterium]|nr:GxxExxY protein [Flavobacteriales bacterium]